MNNDNRGSISKNKRKEQDKHPDYRGSATIEGKQYWICLLYTSPSPRDRQKSRMPSSA